MAKNWSMKEAANEILAGNKEAIVDVGRRFPLTANAIASMGNNSGALTIINALPDYITARKIEGVLKDGVQDIEDDEITEPEEKPVVKEEKEEKKGRGRKKKEEPMNEPETEDDEEDLSGMSAVELFKLCKKRGIKAEAKKDEAYYINLLAPKTEDEDDDWDDEEEEAKSQKPAKKADKKAAPKKEEKKPAKKAAKKDDDDEDDDWDI